MKELCPGFAARGPLYNRRILGYTVQYRNMYEQGEKGTV